MQNKRVRRSLLLIASACLAPLLLVLLSAPLTAVSSLAPTPTPAAAEGMIYLKSRTFAPQPGVEPALRAELAAAGARRHGLIQLEGVPDDAQRQALEQAGVRLLAYIPEDAWLASLPPDPDGVGALSGVRWTGRLRPQDRVAPALHEGRFGSWAVNPDGTVELWVDVFEDVPLEEAAQRVAAHGGKVLKAIPELSRLIVWLPQGALWALAAEDAVQWIDQQPPPPQAANDGSRANIQADAVQDPPYNLDGNGVQAAIWDEGLIDINHRDFRNRLTLAEPMPPAPTPTPTPSSHATHVAGTMGGDGANSQAGGGAVEQWRGVAPGVDIISYDWDDRITEHRDAINNRDGDLSQNSWGWRVEGWQDPHTGQWHGNCDIYGDYDQTAREYDRIVTGVYTRRIPVIFSAMNERDDGDCPSLTGGGANNPFYRNIPPPGQTSKNTITVGAINSDDNSMTAFSSWGPVDDGRIKPDVVAPGCERGGERGIRSTRPGGGYGLDCGTSMAAPAVSGSIALMLQRYRAICPAGGQDPLPSTLKALLIHTARDLDDNTTWFNRGPDYASGYGRINVKDAIDMIPYHVEDSVSNGGTDTYNIVVTHQDALKVTLVWDDVAAAANASVALVNNLDLELVDPQGTVHRPWVLDPNNPANAATRGVDNRNVVEQVVVDNPTPGTWTVRVRGTKVPKGPQRYSLVSDLLTTSSCTGAPATDVWLRDSATDTGVEPSSGTLWNSPDIWVRNQPDGKTTHQNPVGGLTNYVYVRVRNRGSQRAHNIRVFVYYADSSTALTWPGDFRLVGTATVVNLAPGASRMVGPIPWWTPSDPGCLVPQLYVRLVTPQDPIGAEVSDVVANTRNHNEIAWRHVMVVEPPFSLWPMREPTSPTLCIPNIRLRNPLIGRVVLGDLLFRKPAAENFLDLGRVVLDLGPQVFPRWQEASGRGQGFELLGGTQLEIYDLEQASIEGIPLEPGEEQVITMTLQARPGEEARTYGVEVQQLDDQGTLMGGMSFEIHTPATPIINQVYYTTTGVLDDNQFITLLNPHADTVYLDGLAVGLGYGDGVAAVFRFPGQQGDENYPLPPGARVVLARDAVDDGADVELGLADWEFHAPDDDFDNPDVPNLELVFGAFADAELPEAGGVLLATGEDLEPPVDAETVMDGVNYGLQDPLAWLPADTLTAEAGTHAGCSVGQSLQRIGPDTDNSSNDFACDTALLAADLMVALAPPTPAPPGGGASYQLVYRNEGPAPAEGITLLFDLPDGSAGIATDANPPIPCEPADPVQCTIDQMPPDSSGTVSVQITLPEVPLGARLPVTATISQATVEANAGNNQVTGETLIEVIDLAVAHDATTRSPARDVGPEPAVALASGRVVTFTTLIQNLGGVEAPAAVITQDLPSELTFFSYTSSAPVTLTNQADPLVWEVGAIPPGAAYGIVVQALAETDVTGTLTSTVEIATEGDWDLANNQASAEVAMTAAPAIEFCPDFDNDERVTATDLQMAANAWRTADATYDRNKDGLVTVADLLLIARMWGDCPPIPGEDPFNLIYQVTVDENGQSSGFEVSEIPTDAIWEEAIDPQPKDDDVTPDPPQRVHPVLSQRIAEDPTAVEPVIILLEDNVQVPRFPDLPEGVQRDSPEAEPFAAQAQALINLLLSQRSASTREFLAAAAELGVELQVTEQFWLINGFLTEVQLSQVETLLEIPQLTYIQPRFAGEEPPQTGDGNANNDVDDGRARIVSDPYFNLNLTWGWIGLLDTGITRTHVLFNNPSNVGYLRDCVNGGKKCKDSKAKDWNPYDDCWNHGTSSAAIIAANNRLGDAYRGVTAITLDSWQIYGHERFGSSCQGYLDTAAAVRAFQQALGALDRVIVGEIQAKEGENGAIALAADNAHNVGAVVVAANGNYGPNAKTVASPGLAHKVIGVGAHNVVSQAQYNGQGRGPAPDGRYKPDLQAPTDTETASNAGTNALRVFGGTSGATPYAAAAAALMRNWLGRHKTWDNGHVYAHLMNSGTLAWPNYSNTQGLGQLRMPVNGRVWWGKVRVNQGTVIDIPINIGANRRDLRAALWWPEAQKEKHDDIDVHVIDPTGVERAKGYSAVSIFERAQVSGSLTPGTWKIRIKGYNVKSGPQTVYWVVDVHR